MTSDEVRDRIAAELRPAEPWPHAPRPEVIADALLPVVREAVAAELDAAADEALLLTGTNAFRALRDRAARWRADQ